MLLPFACFCPLSDQPLPPPVVYLHAPSVLSRRDRPLHAVTQPLFLLLAAEAALPVYIGAGSGLRLLQDALFDEVLASKGVQVREPRVGSGQLKAPA